VAISSEDKELVFVDSAKMTIAGRRNRRGESLSLGGLVRVSALANELTLVSINIFVALF
jgi:hypothetical protein